MGVFSDQLSYSQTVCFIWFHDAEGDETHSVDGGLRRI